MKYWLIIIAVGLVCTGFVYDRKSYGDAREREGYKSALLIQTNTNLASLVAWGEQQQKISQQVQHGLNGLNAFDGKVIAGAGTQYAYDRLRDAENGLPDGAYLSPAPSRKSGH